MRRLVLGIGIAVELAFLTLVIYGSFFAQPSEARPACYRPVYTGEPQLRTTTDDNCPRPLPLTPPLCTFPQ